MFFHCASCKPHEEKVDNYVTYYFIRLLCDMTAYLYVDTYCFGILICHVSCCYVISNTILGEKMRLL